jgi:microcystin-dependent protein
MLSIEARAQEPYVGQLLPVAFNFCPFGSMPAAGQKLPISEYTTLYSVLGSYYGGDGITTFLLPDLRGRVPVGNNQNDLEVGQMGGTQHQQIDLPPKTADSKPVDIQGTPYLAITWCIVIQGRYPSRN